MNIYGVSDIHLGIRNEKINDMFFKNFIECLDDISSNGNDNIVLIAGDLFNAPIIRNDNLSSFLKIVSKYSNSIKFIISAGNHDISPVRKDSSIEIIEEMLNFNIKPNFESENMDMYSFDEYSDLPNIIIAASKFKRVIIEKEELIIDLLPYYMNKTEFSIKRKDRDIVSREGFKNILLCHGISEPNDLFSEEDVIDKSYFAKRDFILKGHVHSIYEENISGSFVFSAGGFNNTNQRSNGCCIEINLEENNEDTEKGCKYKVIDFSSSFTINYKIFNSETKDTINNTLSTLGKNDIAYIQYFGIAEDINSEEYMRCFKECIKFHLIFSDMDLEVSNFTNQDIRKMDFTGFFDFMNDSINKMSKESGIEIIQKIYNKLLNSKERNLKNE